MTLRETERTSSEFSDPGAPAPPPLDRTVLLDVIGDLEEALSIPAKRQRGVCWTCGTDHDNEARLNRAVMAGLLHRLRAAAAPASPRLEMPENKDDEASRVGGVPKFDHGDLPRENRNEPASVAAEPILKERDERGHHIVPYPYKP